MRCNGTVVKARRFGSRTDSEPSTTDRGTPVHPEGELIGAFGTALFSSEQPRLSAIVYALLISGISSRDPSSSHIVVLRDCQHDEKPVSFWGNRDSNMKASEFVIFTGLSSELLACSKPLCPDRGAASCCEGSCLRARSPRASHHICHKSGP